MKISVIGQGYVGLTVALFSSESGLKVTGFDLNSNLVKQLNSGISHVEGLSSSKLQNSLKNGTYRATTDPNDIEGSDVVVIAVPTPLTVDRKPDLSFINSACQIIGKHLTNNALIINESTSFPGTVRNFIKPTIEKIATESKHEYAVSPERVDPGREDWDQHNTPRLFAGLCDVATEKTRKFYEKFCENLVEVSSPEVAEAAKLFENTFRQVNIALVNEFAQIAYAMDIPVREVLDAANTKPYGFMKFTPSAGVGGHCIPVDPSYLAQVAAEHGVKAKFIELANEVNLQMGTYIVNRVKSDNGGTLKSKNVQLIGVAYKPNVADVRETPAEEIYSALNREGAKITWHDPLVKSWKGFESSALGAEIAIVVTKHDEIDASQILSSANYIFDTTGKVIGATQL
jgi:UDP-N-acetyl-D-glucosamine dehydrogenase